MLGQLIADVTGLPLPPIDQTAIHSGSGLEAVTLVRSRIRDGRSHVVMPGQANLVGPVAAPCFVTEPSRPP